MAVGRSTFTKRQKEQNRLQKRQEKAERKKQRSQEKTISGPEIDWEGAANQFGETPTEPEDNHCE